MTTSGEPADADPPVDLSVGEIRDQAAESAAADAEFSAFYRADFPRLVGFLIQGGAGPEDAVDAAQETMRALSTLSYRRSRNSPTRRRHRQAKTSGVLRYLNPRIQRKRAIAWSSSVASNGACSCRVRWAREELRHRAAEADRTTAGGRGRRRASQREHA
uniref:hypothetical protein n=1 Tax=Streptomyces sp. WSLK1-5 TaxID=3375473 RepID=UPI0037D9D0C6